jgi:hypothetical protein
MPNVKLDPLVSRILTIVGVAFALIIGLQVLAAFMPSLFDSTAAITENITAGDVGNDQANTILHIFGFLVPVVIVLAIVGIIFFVVQRNK